MRCGYALANDGGDVHRGTGIRRERADLKKPRPDGRGSWILGFGVDFVSGLAARYGLEASLEGGGRLKTNRLGGGDFHGLSSLRVAALTSSTFFDFECSESDDLDFLIFLYAFGDGGENGFEGLVSRALSGVFSEGDLNGINEFSFVHGEDVSENAPAPWQEKIL